MIVLPAMTRAQEAGWLGLLDLSERLPNAQWTLIGGQMVHLHCAERGYLPRRATSDIDTVLDVKANPQILLAFTEVLLDLGFRSVGPSAEDKEHRFSRGAALIDVLIPDGVGNRLPQRKGATGSATVQTPGGNQALRRSETVDVEVAGRPGRVHRPNLLGALIVKAAAHTTSDPAKGRHRADFATLAAMLFRADLAERCTTNDLRYLRRMLVAVADDQAAVDGLPEIRDGLARLTAWVG